MVPWGTRFPLVGPNPLALCLVVGGRDDSSPTPFPLEVGLDGYGGGGRWGLWPHGWEPVTIPCVDPLPHVHGSGVLPLLVRAGVRGGCLYPAAQSFTEVPHMGDGVHGVGVGVLVNYLLRGYQTGGL